MLQRMIKNKFFLIGSILAFIIVLFSIFSPLIIRFDPIAISLTGKLTPPEGFSRGLDSHILGTDQMGRDIFARLLIGSRYSLIIATLVVFIAGFIGVSLGIIAGYTGKAVDAVIMRICDVFLSVPNIVLAISVMAILGTNMRNLVAVLIASSWVQYCRITRNNVLVIKNMEFVQASKVMGSSTLKIMFHQIFPNITTPMLIALSQQFGHTILTEAALSFLNLGIQPPIPSWGNMIANGRSYLVTYPWMVFAPGIALMVTVLAFNFLGDGLRDVLDPKRD